MINYWQPEHWSLPFRARILEFGFIKAESAVIGLLNGCIGMFISTITTLFWGVVSLTQMYLSDSMVTWVNVINCELTPILGNCKHTKLNEDALKQTIPNRIKLKAKPLKSRIKVFAMYLKTWFDFQDSQHNKRICLIEVCPF